MTEPKGAPAQELAEPRKLRKLTMTAQSARKRAVRLMRGLEDAGIIYRLRPGEFDEACGFIAKQLHAWEEKAERAGLRSIANQQTERAAQRQLP